MTDRCSIQLRPLLRALALGLLAAAVLVPDARAASRACEFAHANPTTASDRQLRGGTLCLLNRIRARRGLTLLRPSRPLRRAATGHARDMAEHRYFSHRSRTGRSVADRILATNYVPDPDLYWIVGEVLAWARAKKATPRLVVGRWMRSRTHRAEILFPKYRDVGIAVIRRPPVRRVRRGFTYVANYGVKSRRPPG